MNNSKQALLSDAIRLLQESHDPKDSFLVKAKLVSTVSVKKQEIAPVTEPPAPIRMTPSLPKRKAPLPALKQEPPILIKPLAPKKEPSLNFSELSLKLKQSFPNFPLQDAPLKDEGRFIKALQVDVVIFTFSEGRESEAFLSNLNKAITAHHKPATICDLRQWKTQEESSFFLKRANAKLFIASEAILKSPLFLPFLKELPASSKRFLGEKPLIVLDPFTSYFTDPKSKQSLWNTLCSTLASS